MKRPKIAVFFGTRPEAIKVAPVIKRLAGDERFELLSVSTGQHREMLDQVIDIFDLPVHHDLGVMTPGQTLAGLSSKLIASIDQILEAEQPDFALVQGDTTTVLMASLACFYRRIPTGHIEAGLRTGNLASPFPEEANRVLASPISMLHFAPTSVSEANLLNERIDPAKIFVTGNTVIDALHLEVQQQSDPAVAAKIDEELGAVLPSDWRDKRFVLITGHRRENFGGGFDEICGAISELAERFPDVRFVYPVHLNPNVSGPVQKALGAFDNVLLLPPQSYRPFVALMQACELVLTDSGGVQEEAPGLGKPVLVMRDTTERPEGVDAGTVRLVGPVRKNIVDGVSELLSDREAYDQMARATNPYGDGTASQKILDAIAQHYC
ncbi:MAG TPA: UDP-N-acetylglucosamine 2-epimerase (non-hydrolyzing) [Rhodopirellula baltica]|uniref:UDP-N-acetylglucosamine 2-epimerase (non-hydrolyzing) n=1 Tax=Rhodopirellula baltica (strain DSM 10527 / NCIMB 13988 / SH1) TaxID=243090 RepID=Q7ULZ6_RHOBA|nr:UDP-N-acetylglucosamine 2-epimerase (non-hydrolyzing) [Rhodopirellula baltica]CAD76121.1 UDP-N-acetylglucosamine 2-epimerase [Rhodopirellula baltica SH 1]HBE65230.1 UDP-N-acetylglucosamine 2-epimerase (non-hydrolyzing) [Rhodopirellula baltica]